MYRSPNKNLKDICVVTGSTTLQILRDFLKGVFGKSQGWKLTIGPNETADYLLFFTRQKLSFPNKDIYLTVEQ